MLTILASFAQEESLSVSENCKWSIREKFKNGEPSFFRCYGYKWVDGQLQIVPEEAAVVKRIFEAYLNGKGLPAIRKELNEAGIPSRDGGKWATISLYYMLRNERYFSPVSSETLRMVNFSSGKASISFSRTSLCLSGM